MPDEIVEVGVEEPKKKARETHTRVMVALMYLVYLLALSYTPMTNELKLAFAQWGFWGSVGFIGGKTLQNLVGRRETQ